MLVYLLFLDAMTTTTSPDATMTPTPIPTSSAAVVFDGDPFTFFGSDKLAVRNNEA